MLGVYAGPRMACMGVLVDDEGSGEKKNARGRRPRTVAAQRLVSSTVAHPLYESRGAMVWSRA
jgi:hypothetical protein